MHVLQGGRSSRAHRSWRPAAALQPLQGLQQSLSGYLISDDEDVPPPRRGSTVTAYDPDRCTDFMQQWSIGCSPYNPLRHTLASCAVWDACMIMEECARGGPGCCMAAVQPLATHAGLWQRPVRR